MEGETRCSASVPKLVCLGAPQCPDTLLASALRDDDDDDNRTVLTVGGLAGLAPTQVGDQLEFPGPPKMKLNAPPNRLKLAWLQLKSVANSSFPGNPKMKLNGPQIDSSWWPTRVFLDDQIPHQAARGLGGWLGLAPTQVDGQLEFSGAEGGGHFKWEGPFQMGEAISNGRGHFKWEGPFQMGGAFQTGADQIPHLAGQAGFNSSRW